MKLQLCVDLSTNDLFLEPDSASYDCQYEDWDQLSKVSKDNPTYWIRWRDGSKVLIPQDTWSTETSNAKHKVYPLCPQVFPILQL